MSVRTTVEITVYKKNGIDTFHGPGLVIKDDGVWTDRVVLVVGDDRYTVSASDLCKAIQKASGK